MKRLLCATAVIGLFLVLLAPRPAETEAAWSPVTDYVTLSAVSGVLHPVPTVNCGAAAGLIAESIPISWTTPPTTGNGIAPTIYRIDYRGSAGEGSTTSTTTRTDIPGSSLSFAGTLTVVVYAATGTNWTSLASLQTRTITTTVNTVGVIVGWTCA